MAKLKILGVHGIGDHHSNLAWQDHWRAAIESGLRRWNPSIECEFSFLLHDSIFAQYPISAIDVAQAVAKLGASGLVHSIGDAITGLFSRKRGFIQDVSSTVRWTAGMVVQWAENDALRAKTRRAVLKAVKDFQPDVICAHSLGTLLCYDTFVRGTGRTAIAGRRLITFGSQIGSPFVRSTFGGRIVPLKRAKDWYHLYNSEDAAFAAPIELDASNFVQVSTEFDEPGMLDHNAIEYLTHPNTVSDVWGEIAAAKALPGVRAVTAPAKPRVARRALLVGINDYPDPASRLEGCVNDVFRVSATLQESGFRPEDIRAVLNERATASTILDRLHWLLDGVKDGDERVFYYSGHGAQIPAYGEGDAVDHQDECLVPYDFNWAREHAVTDDQFYDLYSQLPYGARFVAVLDCCHSGGMTRAGGSKVRGIEPPDDIRHRMLEWDKELQMWRERKLQQLMPGLKAGEERTEFVGEQGSKRRLGRAIPLRPKNDRKYDRERDEAGHYGPYMPLLLEACQEQEFAYEYREGVTSYGAFTFSLTEQLRRSRLLKKTVTFEGLVRGVADALLKLGYDQHPSLVGPGKLKSAPVPWSGKA
jgi:hypothetical protein